MSKVFAIALNTWREAIRAKVLYSILLFAFVTVGVGAMLGAASIGDQIKFVKDFSLMSVSLFGVVIAAVLGVTLLHNELGRRTILNILSKPVPRWHFIVGKYCGLCATMTLIVSLMAAGLVAFLAALEGRIDWGVPLVAGMALVELFVVIAIALFFSAIVVTPTLAGLFTAATFIAGRSAHLLGYFTTDDHAPLLRQLSRALYWTLPHLGRFTIADSVVYGDWLGLDHILALIAYAVAYAGGVLLLSTAIFSRRELI